MAPRKRQNTKELLKHLVADVNESMQDFPDWTTAVGQAKYNQPARSATKPEVWKDINAEAFLPPRGFENNVEYTDEALLYDPVGVTHTATPPAVRFAIPPMQPKAVSAHDLSTSMTTSHNFTVNDGPAAIRSMVAAAGSSSKQIGSRKANTATVLRDTIETEAPTATLIALSTRLYTFYIAGQMGFIPRDPFVTPEIYFAAEEAVRLNNRFSGFICPYVGDANAGVTGCLATIMYMSGPATFRCYTPDKKRMFSGCRWAYPGGADRIVITVPRGAAPIPIGASALTNQLLDQTIQWVGQLCGHDVLGVGRREAIALAAVYTPLDPAQNIDGLVGEGAARKAGCLVRLEDGTIRLPGGDGGDGDGGGGGDCDDPPDRPADPDPSFSAQSLAVEIGPDGDKLYKKSDLVAMLRRVAVRQSRIDHDMHPPALDHPAAQDHLHRDGDGRNHGDDAGLGDRGPLDDLGHRAQRDDELNFPLEAPGRAPPHDDDGPHAAAGRGRGGAALRGRGGARGNGRGRPRKQPNRPPNDVVVEQPEPPPPPPRAPSPPPQQPHAAAGNRAAADDDPLVLPVAVWDPHIDTPGIVAYQAQFDEEGDVVMHLIFSFDTDPCPDGFSIETYRKLYAALAIIDGPPPIDDAPPVKDLQNVFGQLDGRVSLVCGDLKPDTIGGILSKVWRRAEITPCAATHRPRPSSIRQEAASIHMTMMLGLLGNGMTPATGDGYFPRTTLLSANGPTSFVLATGDVVPGGYPFDNFVPRELLSSLMGHDNVTPFGGLLVGGAWGFDWGSGEVSLQSQAAFVAFEAAVRRSCYEVPHGVSGWLEVGRTFNGVFVVVRSIRDYNRQCRYWVNPVGVPISLPDQYGGCRLTRLVPNRGMAWYLSDGITQPSPRRIFSSSTS